MDQDVDFEEKIKQLRDIVEKLESDIPLEEGMKLFDAGLKLTRECVDALNKTQTDITELKSELNDALSKMPGDSDER